MVEAVNIDLIFALVFAVILIIGAIAFTLIGVDSIDSGFTPFPFITAVVLVICAFVHFSNASRCIDLIKQCQKVEDSKEDYSFYLNGLEVDYDDVDFSEVEIEIDEEDKEVHLTSKDSSIVVVVNGDSSANSSTKKNSKTKGDLSAEEELQAALDDEYPVFLDGVEVEAENLDFSLYQVKVDTEKKKIFCTRK